MENFIWSGYVWVVPLVMVVISYITGDLLCLLFKNEKGFAVKILVGFCTLLCLFHITSLPFMYNDWPFSTLYTLFLCDILGIFITYILLSLIQRRLPLKTDIRGFSKGLVFTAKRSWWSYLIWAGVFALILYQLYEIILYTAYNVDDNFYIAESVTILSRNHLLDVVPSGGMAGSVFPATYQLVSWEILIAALSKLFCLDAAVLCHSVLPALLVPLHYLSLYLVGRELGRKKLPFFMLFAVLLNLVCGPSTYGQGAFLTLRIWQGKAVFVNILLPLLLFIFIRLVKTKKVNVRNIFFLFTILLASQATTTVGTYLAPVLYAAYAIAFLIITGKWKEFFKLFIPAAGIAPFVFWKLALLIQAGSLSSLSEGSGVFSKSFYEIITRYYGWNFVPFLLILAIIILAIKFKGQKENPLRFFFLIASAFLIVLFINPFTMPYVERFVTGVGVYWRVFWLLQPVIVISAGFAVLTDIPKKHLVKVLLLLFISSVLLLSGRSIFKDEDMVKRAANKYKISETTISIADAIEEDIRTSNPEATEAELKERVLDSVVLLPKTLSLELRQYKDIPQIYYVYLSNNYPEYQTDFEYARIRGLYSSLYAAKTFDAKHFLKDVKFLDIDYVAIGAPTVKANEDSIPKQFELIYEGSRYNLYKTNINN
ncbi:MAG: DUF6077 domain-containing protein [Lachnospiraceae bacterium]|nr:DUF6077 domain-containing protein [Lachnospiraceae bacterium]